MKICYTATAAMTAAILACAPAKADIRIGSAEFKEEVACPSSEKFECAPTNDPRLYLDDNPILERDDNEIWSYIGGLKTDRSGSIPARCIEGDLSPETLAATKINSFEIAYKRNSQNRFGFGVDLIKALSAGGLNDALLERASAGINAAYAKIGSQSVNVEAEYWTYKLKNSEISALKGIGADPVFRRCKATLATDDDFGIVIGIGGFWVRQSTAISETSKALAAGVRASLSEAGATEEQIASVETTIASLATQKATTELVDVFEGRTLNFIDTKNIITIAP